MPPLRVSKTSLETVPFDSRRIRQAIKSATCDAFVEMTDQEIDEVTQAILRKINQLNVEELTVDDIHNYVVVALRAKHYPTAVAYTGYRKRKQQAQSDGRDITRALNYAQHISQKNEPIDDEALLNYEKRFNRMIYKAITKHQITQPIAVLFAIYHEIDKLNDNYLLTFFHKDSLSMTVNKVNIINELAQTTQTSRVPLRISSEQARVLLEQRQRIIDFCVDRLLVQMDNNPWTDLAVDLVSAMNKGYPLALIIDYTITHTNLTTSNDNQIPEMFHCAITALNGFGDFEDR